MTATYTPRTARLALDAYYAALSTPDTPESFKEASAAISEVMASTCTECPHDGRTESEVLTEQEIRKLLVSGPIYRSLVMSAGSWEAVGRAAVDGTGMTPYVEQMVAMAHHTKMEVIAIGQRGVVPVEEDLEVWKAMANRFGDGTLVGNASLDWLQLLYNVGRYDAPDGLGS